MCSISSNLYHSIESLESSCRSQHNAMDKKRDNPFTIYPFKLLSEIPPLMTPPVSQGRTVSDGAFHLHPRLSSVPVRERGGLLVGQARLTRLTDAWCSLSYLRSAGNRNLGDSGPELSCLRHRMQLTRSTSCGRRYPK